MITAISSVRQNVNLNSNSKRTNNVAFKGNPVSLLKNSGTILKFTERAESSVGRFFKKLLGKAELPFSKKPLTANADLKHILPDGTVVTFHVPEVHVTGRVGLDGSNWYVPDAKDLKILAAKGIEPASKGTMHHFGPNGLPIETPITDATLVKAADTLGAKNAGALEAKAGDLEVLVERAEALTAKANYADDFATKADDILGGVDDALGSAGDTGIEPYIDIWKY